MRLNDYQNETELTAVYPTRSADRRINLEVTYTALGLVGEAGEVAEKVKKAIREQDDDYYDQAIDELGDTLWYLSRCADELDVTLEEVANRNLEKLRDRDERDVLTGQGDDR